MKKVLLTLFLSMFSLVNFAQDTITKNDSEIIIAKIIEINPNEIKFKKFNFQDGPTYIEKRSDIKMIVYANGMKEVFPQEQPKKVEVQITDNTDYYGGKENTSNKIEVLGQVKFRQKGMILNERKLQNILVQTKDKKIVALVSDAKMAKGVQYIGFAAIPFGVAALALFASSPQYSYSGTTTFNEGMLAGSALCLVAAIACPITSGIFKKKRLNNNREAIKLYNEKF